MRQLPQLNYTQGPKERGHWILPTAITPACRRGGEQHRQPPISASANNRSLRSEGSEQRDIIHM
ncbi:hypothetical protein A8C56_17240 [Niabella ginsenosidivorans]|uniref:Uncharacterized protein n=1 Tax=Niabella ginsenosidivorans TaxID=1176587 RepID=A0A1A9I6Z7_9BACT|nr:hypothetical protein A8C56_17240 [Niabella ginsenosidivorans]